MSVFYMNSTEEISLHPTNFEIKLTHRGNTALILISRYDNTRDIAYRYFREMKIKGIYEVGVVHEEEYLNEFYNDYEEGEEYYLFISEFISERDFNKEKFSFGFGKFLFVKNGKLYLDKKVYRKTLPIDFKIVRSNRIILVYSEFSEIRDYSGKLIMKLMFPGVRDIIVDNDMKKFMAFISEDKKIVGINLRENTIITNYNHDKEVDPDWFLITEETGNIVFNEGNKVYIINKKVNLFRSEEIVNLISRSDNIIVQTAFTTLIYNTNLKEILHKCGSKKSVITYGNHTMVYNENNRLYHEAIRQGFHDETYYSDHFISYFLEHAEIFFLIDKRNSKLILNYYTDQVSLIENFSSIEYMKFYGSYFLIYYKSGKIKLFSLFQ